MKPRAILLTLSLLANAGLVIAYFAASAAPSHSAAGTQDLVGAGPAKPATANPAASQSEAAKRVAASAAGFSWAAIATDDLDEFVRRLKAAGFTPPEVRLILQRQIAETTRMPGSGDATKSTPYWRPPYRYDVPTGKAAEELRQRIAEQARLQRKYLMGPDSLTDDPEQIDAAKRRWGDLPLEKLQAITTIEADYQELTMKQYAEQRTRPGEESNAMDAQRLLQQEHLADIAKVLTPEEFAAYELRASSTANVLRFRLGTFNATEEEYKALFAITKAYEARFDDRQLGPEARKALTDEINAKVKATLGSERALDYDAAVNQNSQDKTAGLVSRLGLPARVATEVRQAQQDFTQRAKEIRANTQLAPNERSTQLDALARQAETQLTSKLGADGFEAYFDIKGDWLRAIQAKGP